MFETCTKQIAKNFLYILNVYVKSECRKTPILWLRAIKSNKQYVFSLNTVLNLILALKKDGII